MSVQPRPRALLIGVGRAGDPWWWKHVDHGALGCQLDYQLIRLEGGRPASPFTLSFLVLGLRATRLLLQARRDGYRYVFSFENDWLTFIIAGLQTLLMFRTPRHVIVQFIMREKAPSVKSGLKYAFMRWCFSSVYLCVCSSRPEAKYYERAFGWPSEKLAFVPFHTDPAFVDRPPSQEEPFILSAGRTFRDYQTLLDALAGTDLSLTIVAGRHAFGRAVIPANVTVRYDLPLPELIGLISRSMVVVLPLQEREISTGQSVLLEAMAMGKAVVATRVNGTVDYIEHMRTGLLVPPNDSEAMREALTLLVRDPELRRRIGDAGRKEVLQKYLPNHYAQEVSRVLRGLR